MVIGNVSFAFIVFSRGAVSGKGLMLGPMVTAASPFLLRKKTLLLLPKDSTSLAQAPTPAVTSTACWWKRSAVTASVTKAP